MKYSILIMFIVLVLFARGQTIRFQLLRKDFCTGLSHIDSTGYSLTSNLNDTTYIALYQSKNGIISLLKVGTYFINTYNNDSIFTHLKIEIKDTGLFVYTFNEPRLIGAIDHNIVDPFLQYTICNRPANGYQEDFYGNGNLRIRGNFTNGQPLDSVITFYPNGIPKTRRFFLKKQNLIEKYDPLFNLVERSKNKKGYGLTDYQKKTFFSDKKIKLSENRKNGIYRLKEYYENGNVKTIQTRAKRIEYYPNGKIACSYEWKRVKETTTNGFSFVVNKTTFDLHNKIEDYQVYENWTYNNKVYQPVLDIHQSDWIILWRKEKDGVAITICEDISTGEYFKD